MKRDYKWIFTITLLAFLITILFTLGSQSILKDVNIVVGIIIILVFIILGVLFDIIGVAVQSSEEQSFHAMASKKVKGAKTANKMLQNSDKVSSFCNDVIGDICGIISGSAGVVIASKPLVEYVPLQKNDESIVTQFGMTTLEELGLLKMDVRNVKC